MPIGPAHTERFDLTPTVSIADAKQAIGIVSDSSMDGQVRNLLQAATELVGDWVAGSASPATVVDYYGLQALGQSVYLSNKPMYTDSLAVALETSMGGPSSVGHQYDPTDTRPVVIVSVVDPLPETIVVNPLSIRYEAVSEVSLARVNNAVLQVVPLLFQGGAVVQMIPRVMEALGLGQKQ